MPKATTITGSSGGALAELRKRLKAFSADHGSMNIERFDASNTSLPDLQAALTSLPFLSAKKCVVIEGLAADDYMFEKLQKHLKDTDKSLELILREPNIDKRKKTFKWLKTNTDLLDFTPRTGQDLVQLAIYTATENSAELGFAEARYLVERLGDNEAMVLSDTAKISVHGKITKDLIDSLTQQSPTSKIFDLLAAATSGNQARAMQIYAEQRAQKVEPQAILGLIVWQIQMFVLAKTASTPLSQVAKAAGVKEFPLSKAASAVRGMSLNTLNKQLQWVVDADRSTRVDYANADDSVKLLILQLCS